MTSLHKIVPSPDADHLDLGISIPDCMEIVEIAREILAWRRPLAKPGKIEHVAETLNKIFLLISAGGVIVVALIALFVGHTRNDAIIRFVEWFGIATQVFGVAALVSIVVGQAAYAWRARRAKISPILGLAREDVQEYLPFLKRLGRFHSKDLRYVADHLSWHQEAFDRRRHALTGPVEKIGLVPLVVAAITGAPKVFEAMQSVHVEPFGKASFAWGFLTLVAAFYIMAWITWPHSSKLQRTWWVINWAAEHSPQEEGFLEEDVA